jgi:hypothetical protein
VKRGLALLVPLLGLGELFAHLARDRAPEPEEWQDSVALVDRLWRPGSPIVVAPAWAEPLARFALGERMPLKDVARADESGYPDAIELSILGEGAPELAGWKETATASEGPFRVRRLVPPRPVTVLYRALEHVNAAALSVETALGDRTETCAFVEGARVTSGGLGGAVTAPPNRFQCPDDLRLFVGVTAIDGPDYRPRLCLHARPPLGGTLRLRFRDVPLGKMLVGYAGSSHLLGRASTSSVSMTLRAGDSASVQRFRDADGLRRFEVDTAASAGHASEVAFEITGSHARDADFCLLWETR